MFQPTEKNPKSFSIIFQHSFRNANQHRDDNKEHNRTEWDADDKEDDHERVRGRPVRQNG